MSFFNTAEPLLRFKQRHLDIQDLCGLIRIHLKLGHATVFSSFYTRIDQVFLLWGWICGAIFLTAQFFPISWSLQAIVWSALTILGAIGMTGLAWFWVKVEKLAWLIYWWTVLMLVGVALTDYGIFHGCGEILTNLCPLWLAIVAIGYFGMGLGMQSRTFCLTGLIHGLAIGFLPYVGGWQFFTTGMVMGGSLLLLAELQWDMRPPIEVTVLTEAERQFNREQHRLRQINI
jgi:hypothetical protein